MQSTRLDATLAMHYITLHKITVQYSTVQCSTVPGPPVVGQHPDPGDAALHRLRGLRAAVHLNTEVDSFVYSDEN